MKLPRGKIKLPIKITGERELTGADLPTLAQPRAKPSRITQIRNSHHRVALLLAYGLPYEEIAEATGYSYARVSTLALDPTIQELAAQKRGDMPEPLVQQKDEYLELKFRNMIAAERHMSDHIEELDESGELLPARLALAISADAADRLGYSKHTVTTNINHEFGARLEKAIARSGIQIEGVAAPATPLVRGPAQDGAGPVLLPFKRRI